MIYASNSTEDRIAVFPLGACGDVAPSRTIEGGRTGLAEPRGLSLDAWGRLHVANRKTATVTVYAPGAQGNAAPLRVLGAGTMHTAEAIAIGHDGDVFVASRTNGTIGGQASIVHFRSRSTHSDYTITGPRTGLTYPVGLALADDGTLLVVAIQVARGTPSTLIGVADSAHAAVHLIRTGGVAPALRVAAVASIAGPATGLGAAVGGLAFA